MIQTPHLATDGIVEIFDEVGKFLGIVFIERKNPPFGMALPGGFVDIGESTKTAVVREMKEEISLDVKIKKLLGVYCDPKRDERFHCVSVVYVCEAVGTPIAADDAKKVFVYDPRQVPTHLLVFDHKEILEDYLQIAFGL